MIILIDTILGFVIGTVASLLFTAFIYETLPSSLWARHDIKRGIRKMIKDDVATNYNNHHSVDEYLPKTRKEMTARELRWFEKCYDKEIQHVEKLQQQKDDTDRHLAYIEKRRENIQLLNHPVDSI